MRSVCVDCYSDAITCHVRQIQPTTRVLLKGLTNIVAYLCALQQIAESEKQVVRDNIIDLVCSAPPKIKYVASTGQAHSGDDKLLPPHNRILGRIGFTRYG